MAVVLTSTSAADPYILHDIPVSLGGPIFPTIDTSGKTLRSPISINSSLKNLILLVAGQSNRSNMAPTVYTATNASVIDNFNVYDGGNYSLGGTVGTLVGCDWFPQGGLGKGNIAPRVADLLINNGKFDRVILVPLSIAGTSVADWATSAVSTRIKVAMLRLKAAGLIPGMTGVTFALEWGQGEADQQLGTSQGSYTTSMNTVITNTYATGFTGRFFVSVETWNAGATSAAVQAAQAAVVDNVNVFQSGNLDTLNNTNRQDTTHFNDTGAAAAATLIYNAMHASGAPF